MSDSTHVKESSQFHPDNQSALKHGAAGALKRVQQGKDFIGIARDAQERVKAELLAAGPGGQVEKNAERLQVCADLYLDAILSAFEKGELDKADRYIKVYGWLASSSLRAWLEVRKIAKEGSRTNVIDLLKGGNNDPD